MTYPALKIKFTDFHAGRINKTELATEIHLWQRAEGSGYIDTGQLIEIGFIYFNKIKGEPFFFLNEIEYLHAKQHVDFYL